MLGGYTEMEREAPRPGVELFVSLAGPVVSLVLGLLAAGAAVVLPSGGVAETFAFQLALSNIVVAVFNALPGLPLDGGRALQALVWKASGDANLGRRVAGWSGRLVALATAATVLVLFLQGVLEGFFGLVFTLLVAVTLWVGAGQAIRHGKIAASLPRFSARELARPVVAVTAATPLAEAERLASPNGHEPNGHEPNGQKLNGQELNGQELNSQDLNGQEPNGQETNGQEQRPVIAVVDGDGGLIGFVHGASARAVPPERRPWVPVGDVTRRIDPQHVLTGELWGTDLLQAIRDDPAGDYLVVSGEDVHGVLRGADLVSLVEPYRPHRPTVRRNRT
jgi:hypothetical protein